MSTRYYAVVVGRHPGVYSSFAEVRPQVEGYVGAAFQSFQILKKTRLSS